MLIPNTANPIPQGINAKAFLNFEARNQAGPAKIVHPLVAPASKTIRIGDPITISSGQISRGDQTSAALYGFAVEPNIRQELPQFPTMPYNTDTVNGVTYKENGVYVGGGGNEFIGQVAFGLTLAISMVGAQCDLAPMMVSPAPVITQGGASGATTQYYQVTAVNAIGEAKSVAATSTTTANAALSAMNYNILTIPAVAGAIWFNIFRGTASNNCVLIAQISAVPGESTVYNDIGGQTVTTIAAATQNDAGWVVAATTSSTNVCVIRELVEPYGTLSGPNTTARVIFAVPSAQSQWA